MSNFVICAMYKFVTLEDYQQLKAPLLNFMLDQDIRGTLLLASEGVNGTVSGSRKSIDALLNYFQHNHASCLGVHHAIRTFQLHHNL